MQPWTCRVFPPPSTNNLYRGRRFKTREYKDWIAECTHLLGAARGRGVPLPPYHLSGVQIDIRVPRNNRRDCDNYLKPIIDLLAHLKVIVGDNMKHVGRVTIEPGDGIEMCVVTVSPLAAETKVAA